MSVPIEQLLFDVASGLTDDEERRAFLDYVCGGNPELRKLLDGMLEVRADAEKFFAVPVQPPTGRAEGVLSNGEEELGARIGRYRLIERIGAGGCGVVYLAEQEEPVRRKVALKIIRLGMDTESVIARFELERQALALMDHPYIARVLDAGATASGRPFFVMELADGEKITDFCDRKRLGLRERLELFVLVCEAIQHAHQKGVIHRDIKPSNVLVREQDGRAVPKVIDFGIAKATAGGIDPESTATKPGQFIGTPIYMSPEQAEGSVDIDTRSDIYSLGALLCELLAGCPPAKFERLEGRGVEEIRSILREGRVRRPSAMLREMPAGELEKVASERGVEPQRLPALLEGDLDWIVLKAVEKERQRRYETANGLAMDVQRHLREEPVLARPPSRWYLLTKTVRRHRAVFAAGAVALFGLLGGFGVAMWLFLREREARQEQARLRVVAEQATANEVRLREYAQAADLVRQAAVLLRYNEVAQADKLVEGLPADRVPRSLEAANVLTKVANWNLMQERWQVAAKRFYLLGIVLTSVDMTDSEGISFEFLSIATAVSEWGEPGQFEELRRLAIERFARSSNPIVAEHVVKATLLERADQPTLEKLAPLGEVLEASLARKDKSAHLLAWQQFSLALLAYRNGDLETAAERARASLGMASNSEHRRVSNHLLLAMIDFEFGNVDAARKAVEEARKEVDSWIGRPFAIRNPDGTLWYNQHAVLLLLREAESLMAQGGGESTDAGSASDRR